MFDLAIEFMGDEKSFDGEYIAIHRFEITCLARTIFACDF